MEISVCGHFTFESKACFFSSFDTIHKILEKAESLALKKNLPYSQLSSKSYVWDDLTNQPLDKKQLLMHYYPINSCATIRVEIEDYLTRGVLFQ
jgi:hypothetical protein